MGEGHRAAGAAVALGVPTLLDSTISRELYTWAASWNEAFRIFFKFSILFFDHKSSVKYDFIEREGDEPHLGKIPKKRLET